VIAVSAKHTGHGSCAAVVRRAAATAEATAASVRHCTASIQASPLLLQLLLLLSLLLPCWSLSPHVCWQSILDELLILILVPAGGEG
jgi:hypothetical protein